MFFRNLLSMDTEEMIKGQPMDGVVLLGGCDKTLPAQLMGAASAGMPAICVTAGPMIGGRFEDKVLGRVLGLPRHVGGITGRAITTTRASKRFRGRSSLRRGPAW